MVREPNAAGDLTRSAESVCKAKAAAMGESEGEATAEEAVEAEGERPEASAGRGKVAPFIESSNKPPDE